MSRPTSLQQDLFCVLLLAVFSLTLWLPVLDEVSLNPDESQYEATASYLVASNTSAFLHGVAPFEGFAVNREWFASLATVLGLSLFATIRRHERARVAPGAPARLGARDLFAHPPRGRVTHLVIDG
ncbi:MAG: hypothetical protein IH848_06365 [Acidobacteria bacterium]|nr:hypothetical protein [Acidobacteriota bacterium]